MPSYTRLLDFKGKCTCSHGCVKFSLKYDREVWNTDKVVNELEYIELCFCRYSFGYCIALYDKTICSDLGLERLNIGEISIYLLSVVNLCVTNCVLSNYYY